MATKKEERHRKLIQLLKTKGELSVREFANILSASEMTIRRDLAELGAQRNPGLASDLHEEYKGYDLLSALQKSNETKAEIGKMAASLIRPDEVIAIDTGSTTARMLPFLPEDQNLTVICYNMNVLVGVLQKTGIRPMLCGGIYHPGTEMFESPEGIQFIKRIRANKVFLSAAGVHKELGVTCAYAYEVEAKQAAMQSSAQRILVADSNKFDQVKASYFCCLSDIHVVITDKGLSEEWREYIKEKGIALHVV